GQACAATSTPRPTSPPPSCSELAPVRPPWPRSRARPSRSARRSPDHPAARQDSGMQATVAEFDEEQHHGWVLLDDGRRLDFPTAAFAASGLRLLRVGQRVKIDRDEAGNVVRLTIPTLP